MPRRWKDAIDKFSEDTIIAYGISPWNIQSMLYKLTNAFKEKDLIRILKYSAEIGHIFLMLMYHYIQLKTIMVNLLIKREFMAFGNPG